MSDINSQEKAPFTWKQRENIDYRYEREMERLRDRLDALQMKLIDAYGQRNGELLPAFGFISVFGLFAWINANIVIFLLGAVIVLLTVWNYWQFSRWNKENIGFLEDNISLVESKYSEGISIDRWNTTSRFKWIISIVNGEANISDDHPFHKTDENFHNRREIRRGIVILCTVSCFLSFVTDNAYIWLSPEEKFYAIEYFGALFAKLPDWLQWIIATNFMPPPSILL